MRLFCQVNDRRVYGFLVLNENNVKQNNTFMFYLLLKVYNMKPREESIENQLLIWLRLLQHLQTLQLFDADSSKLLSLSFNSRK